jgi:hypothetical protein
MMALAFLCGIGALFVVVLAWEAGTEQGAATTLRPAGLVRWLVSGNWTAKLGGGLLAIGSGALLRYLMLEISFPAEAKLMAGAAIAVALGAASALINAKSQRRAISLALAGAALAVAYLTAYSAYGFFHYVADLQALGLLFVVAAVATVVAVTLRALSIAVLSMVGAYLAPAFALHEATPASVFGYYVAASVVTLFMVWRRGWRPLIHLSFLFTLAGALFFGWTQQFYQPAYYPQMQPLLLALVGIHLLMPILEGLPASNGTASWQRHLDRGYFLLLPLVAATLTLLIAPRISQEGALGLTGLAMLWLIAGGVQQLRFQQGGLRYASVALLLLVSAGLLAISTIPFLLIAAMVSCLLIITRVRLQFSETAERLAIAVALASSGCYTLHALLESLGAEPFVNLPFLRHALLGVSVLAAGLVLRHRRHALAPVFLIFASTWLGLVLARELFRLHLVHVDQIVHLAVLLTCGVYAIVLQLRSRVPAPPFLLLLGIALFGSAWLCASKFSPPLVLLLLVAGQVLFSWLAHQGDRADGEEDSPGSFARSALPVLALPWAVAFNGHLTHPHYDAVLTLLVCSALFASLQAQWLAPPGRFWPNWLSPVGFVLFALLLCYEALFNIEREYWAVAFELIALGYLIETARYLSASRNRDSQFFNYAAIFAVAAVSAAMLLRLIGPPGTLTILALNEMLLPAVVSLLWAAIGGFLTWLAVRRRSRTLWSLGAVLLIVAAVKLVLFDFGSLSQIGNILAMMAAGGVFLLVAWLAPFPPRGERAAVHPVAPAPIIIDRTAHAPPERVSPTGTTPGPAVPLTGVPAWGSTPKVATAAPPGQMRSTSALPPAAHASEDTHSARGWIWIVAALAVAFLYVKWNEQTTLHRTQESMARQQALRNAPPRTLQAPAAKDSRVPLIGGPDNLSAEPAKDSCQRFVSTLPGDYLVYGAGDENAFPGLEATPRSRARTVIDVFVSDSPQKLVLALASGSPTLWRMRSGTGHALGGVILSGNYHSDLIGLDPRIPLLHAAIEDQASCGYFQINAASPQGANSFVSKLLVHAVDEYFMPAAGRLIIGEQSAAAPSPAVPVAATNGGAIDILSAFYTSPQTGKALDVSNPVRLKCGGNIRQCLVQCGNQLAGDPDFGHAKQCAITYRCASTQAQVAQLQEGQTLQLSCP